MVFLAMLRFSLGLCIRFGCVRRSALASFVGSLVICASLLPVPGAAAANLSGAIESGVDRGIERRWTDAIGRNDVDSLADLLSIWPKQDLPTGRRNGKGKTALMAAAAAGDAGLVRRLLAAGADPAATNVKGASTLMYAAWRGDTQTIAQLLARGVSLEQQASNGWTAMTMAAAKGHEAALAQLLDAGAQVDVRDVYAWTPLMRACNLGRLRAVKVLVGAGAAAVGLINTRGQTALHLAAAANQPAIYALLLAAGADSGQADFAGRTPAQIAAATDSR